MGKKKRKPGRPRTRPPKPDKPKVDQSRVKRDANGKWLPGSVPNPAGRPKGSLDLIAMLRRILQEQGISKDKVKAEEALTRLVVTAIRGKRDADAIRAVESIIDRIHGKPAQTIHTPDMVRDPVAAMPDAELEAELERERKKRESGVAEAEEEGEGEE